MGQTVSGDLALRDTPAHRLSQLSPVSVMTDMFVRPCPALVCFLGPGVAPSSRFPLSVCSGSRSISFCFVLFCFVLFCFVLLCFFYLLLLFCFFVFLWWVGWGWVKGEGVWLAACLTSQQHASVSQGRICSDNLTCCHTEIEVADPTFYLTQSQYTDTGPTSPSADPITPGAWQGSHWSANF